MGFFNFFFVTLSKHVLEASDNKKKDGKTDKNVRDIVENSDSYFFDGKGGATAGDAAVWLPKERLLITRSRSAP